MDKYFITHIVKDRDKILGKSFFMGFEFGFPNFTFRVSSAKAYNTKKAALQDLRMLRNCNIEKCCQLSHSKVDKNGTF